MKVVLDTNVIVSGFYWGGAPREALIAWGLGAFGLVVSAPILEEYRRIGSRMLDEVGGDDILGLLMQIESTAERVEPARHLDLHCDDPDDIKFLEAAVGARARYLVSGDKALLRVGKYPYGEVVTPRRFISALS